MFFFEREREREGGRERERERETGRDREGREVGQIVVLSSDIGKSNLIFLFIYFLLSQLFI